MTPTEFEEWATHHGRCFPAYRSWWNGLHESTRQTLRRQFRQILSRVELRDAIEATDRMLAGQVDVPQSWEMNLTPARIATAASEVASERLPRAPECDNHRHKPAGYPAGQILLEIMRRVEAGEDRQAVCEELIPKATDGRRYSCIRCLDSGYVRVWSVRAIRAVIDKTIDQRPNRTTMTCPCDCHRGAALCIGDDERAPKGWHGYRESQRYSVDRYCRCTGEPDDQRCIDELREWLESAIRRRAEPVTSGVFREWNET